MQRTSSNQSINKDRNSSIELLRIIAMVMIVFHHFSVHGGFDFDYRVITIPRLWYNFIIMGGKIGVDIFVLISGYFLIEDNKYIFNWKRIAKFWGQVFFYSIAITLAFSLIGKVDLGIKEIIKALLPITFTKWWFASTYFVLYLLHPFINKLLRSLDKKTHQVLVVCLLICWCIIPTFTARGFESNSLLWFVVLYCIASYVKLYGLNPKYKSKHYFLMWIVFSILTYISSCVFSILGTKLNFFASHATYFYGQEKITTLLISLSLFMAFATLKMPYRKWINLIASTTFGVYLIHDNGVVRPFLWLDVFKNANYQNSNMIIVYSIIVVCIVFVLCSLIDLVRQKTFEKAYMYFVNKYMDSLVKPFQIICEWIKTIVFGENQ